MVSFGVSRFCLLGLVIIGSQCAPDGPEYRIQTGDQHDFPALRQDLSIALAEQAAEARRQAASLSVSDYLVPPHISIAFKVTAHRGATSSRGKGPIYFDRVDYSRNVDANEILSGAFVAVTPGLYHFTFTAFTKACASQPLVKIVKNEQETLALSQVKFDQHPAVVAASATVFLETMDIVSVSLLDGKLTITTKHPATFAGHLVPVPGRK